MCGYYSSWGSRPSPLRSSLHHDRPVAVARRLDSIRRDALSGLSEGDSRTVELTLEIKGEWRVVTVEFVVERYSSRHGLKAIATAVKAKWQMPISTSGFQHIIRAAFKVMVGLELWGVTAAWQAGDGDQ